MSSYFDHNAGSKPHWLRDGDTVEAPAIMVSEAESAEDRAAFVWAWNRAVREDSRAMLLIEGATP